MWVNLFIGYLILSLVALVFVLALCRAAALADAAMERCAASGGLLPTAEAPDGALANALRDVAAEVARATTKFPTWPTDPIHAFAVLGEEFGELQKDVLQLTYEPHKTSAENLKTEAVQTAAMAIRFYMSLDRYVCSPGVQHVQTEGRAV